MTEAAPALLKRIGYVNNIVNSEFRQSLMYRQCRVIDTYCVRSKVVRVDGERDGSGVVILGQRDRVSLPFN